LRAHGAIVARQAVHGGGFERVRAVAIDVAERHKNLERLVFHQLAGKAEQGF
jgi:hypothetical protein